MRAGVILAVAMGLAAAGLAACGRPAARKPEPSCTVETKEVECWWVLYGCMPELSPRDACLAICRDQELGQLKVCEGKLPQKPGQDLMMSVRHLGCDHCIRLSDKPLAKARTAK
jgi:hypothetical protein